MSYLVNTEYTRAAVRLVDKRGGIVYRSSARSKNRIMASLGSPGPVGSLRSPKVTD